MLCYFTKFSGENRLCEITVEGIQDQLFGLLVDIKSGLIKPRGDASSNIVNKLKVNTPKVINRFISSVPTQKAQNFFSSCNWTKLVD